MLTASSISRADLASFSCVVLANLFTAQQCYFALRERPLQSREHLLRNDFRFRAPLTPVGNGRHCHVTTSMIENGRLGRAKVKNKL